MRVILLAFIVTTAAVPVLPGCTCIPIAEGEGEREGEGEGEGEACTFDGDVTTNVTLIAACSPYILDAIDVSVTNGATLTIEPGVEVRFDSNHWLEVSDGKLVADGTTADPILLTSTDTAAAAGSWLGVVLRSGTISGTILRNVTIRGAGQDGYGQDGALDMEVEQAGRVTLEGLTVERAGSAGLALMMAAPFTFASFSGVAIDDAPIGLRVNARAIGAVTEEVAVTGVAVNELIGDTVETDATLAFQPIPWHVIGDLAVGSVAGATLTVAPGSVLRFESGHWLEVAGGGNPGGLVAVGTAPAPITFEGEQGAGGQAGDWLGVALRSDVRTGTQIAFATVQHGGEDGYGMHGCLSIDSSSVDRVTIHDATFNQCAQAGVYVAGANDGFEFASFTNNTFTASPAGVDVPPSAVAQIDATQSYTTVAENRIGGGVLDRTAAWVGQPLPYRVVGDLEVHGTTNPVLTLQAGVVLRFSGGHWLEVGGNSEPGGLIAQGVSGTPVVFESAEATPAAGSWLGVFFRAGTLNGSLLNYGVVRHAGEGGFGTNGGVTLDQTGTAVTITNTVFSDNALADIWVSCQSTLTASGNTTPTGVVNDGPC